MGKTVRIIVLVILLLTLLSGMVVFAFFYKPKSAQADIKESCVFKTVNCTAETHIIEKEVIQNTNLEFGAYLEILRDSKDMDSPQYPSKKVYKDGKKIVIEFNHEMCQPFKVLCTGSMHPVLDCEDDVIICKFTDSDTLKVGDIIMYDPDTKDMITAFGYNTPFSFVMHRIIEVSQDEEGVYYITRRDNEYRFNYATMKLYDDGFKVRKHNVKWKVAGVVYR